MANRVRVLIACGALVLAGIVTITVTQDTRAQTLPPQASHPAVGSWFGKAMQLCVTGAVPSACSGGQPAITLFMTPTLSGDGGFLGNDHFAVSGPPFGPHTTAHGTWVPTSSTEIVADYVFMQNTFPPVENTITGLRFRWAARVVNATTMVGHVNLYFGPPLPITWTRLLDNEFPAFPSEANILVTSPSGMVRDPNLCREPGCPFVFKFTVKRVQP